MIRGTGRVRSGHRHGDDAGRHDVCDRRAWQRRECDVDAHVVADEVTGHGEDEALSGELDMLDTGAADD